MAAGTCSIATTTGASSTRLSVIHLQTDQKAIFALPINALCWDIYVFTFGFVRTVVSNTIHMLNHLIPVNW